MIYPFLELGFAEPIPQIHRAVGSRAVKLSNGRTLEDIDALIYCIGHDFAIPFLSGEFNPDLVVGEVPKLYRGIVPLRPDPNVRDSLAFLGQAPVTFPGLLLQMELQGMAVSQLWRGLSTTPSLDDMQRWHEGWVKDLAAKQKIKSHFYTALVPLGDHLILLDTTAGTDIFKKLRVVQIKGVVFLVER